MPAVAVAGLIVVVIALVVVLAIQSAKWERERIAALNAMAAKFSLTFDPSNSSHWMQHQHFGLFTRGHSKRAYNTFRGTVGEGDRQLSILAGEYEYKDETGTGKDRKTETYRNSYLIVRPLAFAYPQKLTLRRENVFDKVAGALGFEDIDFESAEFSRRFLVKCDDKKFAYDVIDPRMMEWMMQNEPPQPIQTAMSDAIMVYGGKWKPETLEAAIAWFRDFFERWPRHVVDRLRSEGAMGR
jgi:hypothetical protein